MSDPALPPDVRDHPVGWLHTDAVGLFHLKRGNSSLLLLLCAVDALADIAAKQDKGVGEKFQAFLKSKLPRVTGVENFHIQIPRLGKTVRLERILYKYLRCKLVHVGAHLQVTDPVEFDVCIDWTSAASSVKVDDECVVLGGDWLVATLVRVTGFAIVEDLTTGEIKL